MNREDLEKTLTSLSRNEVSIDAALEAADDYAKTFKKDRRQGRSSVQSVTSMVETLAVLALLGFLAWLGLR